MKTMKREEVLEKTKENLEQLKKEELAEASDFIDYLQGKVAERDLLDSIERQAQEGKTFQFLKSEEELYSDNDLKERYR